MRFSHRCPFSDTGSTPHGFPISVVMSCRRWERWWFCGADQGISVPSCFELSLQSAFWYDSYTAAGREQKWWRSQGSRKYSKLPLLDLERYTIIAYTCLGRRRGLSVCLLFVWCRRSVIQTDQVVLLEARFSDAPPVVLSVDDVLKSDRGLAVKSKLQPGVLDLRATDPRNDGRRYRHRLQIVAQSTQVFWVAGYVT